MAEQTSCCAEPGGYCARVDTLFNSPGVHVLDVAWCEAVSARGRVCGSSLRPARPELVAQAAGVIAEDRGQRVRRLNDIPAFGAPVQLVRGT